MKSFVFHNPTKIIFGNKTISELGKSAKTLGTKALLIYGQNSIKKSGLYDNIIKQLNENGINFVEHGGVKSNPTLSHARESVELGRNHNVDYIIAVGGGSVLDSAKAVAAALGSNIDIWDIFTLKEKITRALPIITALTLPATGSEMNAGMVITNEETNDKFGFGHPSLYPAISILDPELTYSVPLKNTAYSAVDVVSHLTESYFNNEGGWTILQQHFVEGMVKTIIESTDKIMKNPSDDEGRATFMWAATLGWNGLNTAGLGAFGMPCHMLEHPISALYDIAHGAGLAIVTPQWLSNRLHDKREKITHFAKEVFGLDTAEEGIKALKDWYKKIGAPTSFSEAGIENPDIEKLVELTLRGAELRNTPELPRELVQKVFEESK